MPWIDNVRANKSLLIFTFTLLFYFYISILNFQLNSNGKKQINVEGVYSWKRIEYRPLQMNFCNEKNKCKEKQCNIIFNYCLIGFSFSFEFPYLFWIQLECNLVLETLQSEVFKTLRVRSSIWKSWLDKMWKEDFLDKLKISIAKKDIIGLLCKISVQTKLGFQNNYWVGVVSVFACFYRLPLGISEAWFWYPHNK